VELLVHWLARRLRPRVGWPIALLALAVVLSPSVVASDSPLNLPALSFAWAGLIGLILGMRGPTTDDRRRNTQHATRNTQQVSRITLWFLAAILLGALFLLGVAGALPPLGLVFQDGAALWEWVGQVWRQGLGAPQPPLSRTWLFLGESLPRAWRDLAAAPAAGERGARLIVALGGVVLVWAGALVLGWGLARRGALLGWGAPLLAALAFTAILGGGPALPLISGTGLLLLLALAIDFRRREDAWDRAGVDFSSELLTDVLVWGGAAIAVLTMLAALLPAWIDNPIANVLWPNVETPSGLAVLERNIQRGQRTTTADPGLSQLPVLQLGMSLEEQPPEAIALRVRLGAPLPDAPWPRYWRARVFNIYTGRGWTQNARVNALESLDPQAGTFPDSVLQEIEDSLPERQLAFGLPDIIAISAPANIERLPDGAAAALTLRTPTGSYRVLSHPQELAAPPPSDGPPPDMRGYLGLPANLPPQIGETARAVVQGSPTSYAQALALEKFLRELPYSYQVQPLPSGGDAVYQFLFEMRQGYCTYYASAMAVLARSLGIPARVASGYATGTYDQASGAYIVHEADAHAWPELYIDGRWLPFEPTPIRPLPARASGDTPPAPVTETSFEEPPAPTRGLLIWLAVLAALGLLTAGGLWLGRRPAPAPLVAQVQLRLERNGVRAGVPWPSGATLHEYGTLLEPRLDGATGALHELIMLVERARYGRHDLDAREERQLRAAEEQVWARLKHSQ
jgi:transglutaminase-like putative cysteine protease